MINQKKKQTKKKQGDQLGEVIWLNEWVQFTHLVSTVLLIAWVSAYFTQYTVLLWMHFPWVILLKIWVDVTHEWVQFTHWVSKCLFYSIYCVTVDAFSLSNFTQNLSKFTHVCVVHTHILELIYSLHCVTVDAPFTQYFVLFLLDIFCSAITHIVKRKILQSLLS